MGVPLRIRAVLYTAIGLNRRMGHIGRFDRNSPDTANVEVDLEHIAVALSK